MSCLEIIKSYETWRKLRVRWYQRKWSSVRPLWCTLKLNDHHLQTFWCMRFVYSNNKCCKHAAFLHELSQGSFLTYSKNFLRWCDTIHYPELKSWYKALMSLLGNYARTTLSNAIYWGKYAGNCKALQLVNQTKQLLFHSHNLSQLSNWIVMKICKE